LSAFASAGPTGAGTDISTTPQQRARFRRGNLFVGLLVIAAGITFAALVALLWTTIADGHSRLSWDLITSMPSRKAEASGLESALWGTIWVIGLTALFAFPVGTFAAVYLEEYGPKNRFTKLMQINIANLAGVPSIVYGLLGLGIFAEILGMGRSVITGSLTMAILILPIIIISSQEAIRSVPPSLREAGYGLGATKWQVTWSHVLPSAIPGILTGTILAISRAIGESAPLIVAGAVPALLFRPTGLDSTYNVLPLQIYDWISRPQAEFHELAAAGIIVLLIVLIAMNSTAIIIRQRFSNRLKG
jgi:phosphate transport system permease protein